MLLLKKSSVISGSEVVIPGSKSITNRLLVLQAYYPTIKLLNRSTADDAQVMEYLCLPATEIVDVGHAGTAMRFLTAFYASKPGCKVVITGSSRMQNRPIGPLVDALCHLGADITYLENAGFPPIQIVGKALKGGEVKVNGSLSSQFISALMLIGPQLEKGLKIHLQGITSAPYLYLTLAQLQQLGIAATFQDAVITVPHCQAIKDITLSIESDWSSAAFFYSLVALSPPGTQLILSHFYKRSSQGDSQAAEFFSLLGVDSAFQDDRLVLTKIPQLVNPINLDLNATPDLAQPLAVACLGLGISCKLTGLSTLKIKETDRIAALQSELTKFGACVTANNHMIQFGAVDFLPENIWVETYEDHRMAMSFAPLALKVPLVINTPEVVSKSFPLFWITMQKVLQS